MLSVDDIKDILDHNRDAVVVIDEAYIDFGGTSCLSLLDDYENLLIIKTFSKFRSLAGSRLGAAYGNKELISHLYDVKNSFNSYPIDALNQAIGEASVADSAYIEENAKKVMATRIRISAELRELGFMIPESYANFIFISHPEVKAEYLFKELRKKGIIVRYFNANRINNYLRVSIGTDEQMDAFMAGVKEILSR